MPGSLAARDISKSFAAVQVLDARLARRRAGRPRRHRRPERDRQVDPAPRARRRRAAGRGPDRPLAARSATCRRSPRRRPGETRAATTSARRTGVGGGRARRWTRSRARLGAEPELRDALRRRARPLPRARRRATSTPRAAAALADVGLGRPRRRASWRRSPAARRRAPRSPRSCSPASTSSCSTSRRTTSTSPASSASSASWTASPAGVVLVSHDRAFLDRTVTRVVELEAETRRMHEYAGTWSDYEAVRARARERHERAYADYVDERDRYSTLLVDRQNQARARQRSRWRSRRGHATRSASKVEAGEAPPRAARARSTSRGRRGGCSSSLAPPTAGGRWSPSSPARSSSAARSASARSTSSSTSATASPSSAPNGSGKSTLIRALLGDLPLAARLAPHRAVGRLRRARPGARRSSTGGRCSTDFAAAVGAGAGRRAHAAREVRARRRRRRPRPAPSLSPGERTRAALALLSARGVNCLILDEPTNHLDLEAIEELETALAGLRGRLVVVTHDRRFLERLDVTRTLEL